MKALIVDDDIDFINLIKKHLEDQNLDILTAQSGKEALEILNSTEVQLVVSDWNMPEMNGLSLCKKIRELERKGYIYILLLSVRSKREDVLKGLDAGADDYLAKPYDPFELRTRLETGIRILNSDQSFQRKAENFRQKADTSGISNKKLEDTLPKRSTPGNRDSRIPGKLPYKLDEEVDLLEYLAAVFRYKYLIVLSAILCSVAAYGLTYLKPKLYESFVNTTLVEHDNPGGVSPDKRRAPEVMTLVEHGYIMGQFRDNSRDIIMATMRSHLFTTRFITEENVLQQIFEEHWDSKDKKWKDDFKPDTRLAYEIFNSGIRFINFNEETGLMKLRICWKDPELSARWANRYIALFNEHMRTKAMEVGRMKLESLQTELKKTDIVEIQKAIFRLIEAQTAVVMTASARKDYVLEVIDPALPNPDKCSPARRKTVVMAFVAVFALGLAASVGTVITKKLKSAIKKYN